MCENELKEVKVTNGLLEDSEQRSDSHTHPGLHCIREDPDHRKLAICSIICGFSCLGIMSLMYSVKARETRKRLQNEDSPQTRQKLQQYSKKACKWGIGSIAAWVFLILIFPSLVVLTSFLLTFKD